ncbi:MAG: phage holin family protein [Clostridia bacterium]|nr:phage holin family protein [Clostridia bacterium]
MIDLTGVAVAMLSLLAAWITTQAVPWIKARTTAEKRRVAKQLIQTAVYAAEQLYQGGGRGEEKLRYVERRLADAGIKLQMALVTDMIEEAVLGLAIKREWGLEPSNDDEAAAG